MEKKYVRFLGKPNKPGRPLVLEGVGRWEVGESKLFSDNFTTYLGRKPGISTEDFLIFWVGVYNDGSKYPLFEILDAPNEDEATVPTKEKKQGAPNKEERVGAKPEAQSDPAQED